MKLEISTAQLRSLKNGKNIQMSGAQLNGIPKSGSKVHEIEVNDSHVKKMTQAKNKNKGYRLSPSDVEISGSGLFSSISKGVKKATKSVSDSVKKTANKVADVAEDVAEDVADGVVSVSKSAYKGALKGDLGGMVESAKNVVPKSVVETAVTGGITAALVARGMPPEEAEKVASTMSAVAVTGVYEYDFGEAPTESNFKQAGKKAGKAGLKAAVGSGLKDNNKGIGNHAQDGAKYAGRGSGRTVTNMVPKSIGRPAVKAGAIRKINPVVKAQSNIRFDSQLNDGPRAVGSSMVALSAGGSFKEIGSGGSFKPIGSGVSGASMVAITKAKGGRVKMVKGSAEAKAWGERMRNARKK